MKNGCVTERLDGTDGPTLTKRITDDITAAINGSKLFVCLEDEPDVSKVVENVQLMARRRIFDVTHSVDICVRQNVMGFLGVIESYVNTAEMDYIHFRVEVEPGEVRGVFTITVGCRIFERRCIEKLKQLVYKRKPYLLEMPKDKDVNERLVIVLKLHCILYDVFPALGSSWYCICCPDNHYVYLKSIGFDLVLDDDIITHEEYLQIGDVKQARNLCQKLKETKACDGTGLANKEAPTSGVDYDITHSLLGE